MQDCVFGPTLLDMRDIYETKVKIITIVILLRAIGSVIGASIGKQTADISTFKTNTAK